MRPKSKLRRQFEEAKARAEALTKIPADDRTDEQVQELDDQLARAEALKKDLAEEAERNERLAALGEVSRAVAIPGQAIGDARGEPRELTIGQYIAGAVDFLNGAIGAEEFIDRAARYLPDEILDRATTLTTDVAGVIPEPILGPIIDIYDDRRRVFNSFTTRSMPSKGKTFERPRVTQHVGVGTQAAEGDPLTSQKMTATSDTVTKQTIGGTLELPRQVLDWTEPEALGLVVNDFVKVYTRWTESLAVAHLAGLATATETWDPASTASIVNSFVNGALAVSAAVDDDVPLTFWLDTASAAALAAPTGATDRTTWEVVREALSVLDNETRWVVSRRLPAATRIVGAGELVEAYEQRHGLLSVVKPTNLTTDVSYSGYVAFHGIASGFVSMEAA